ncbi:putative polysaccharide biosynthesis protein [Clostridium lundense]|uniref:putative polysaccharide biosynthesis protein n=1 Tax=Clostridium lundense TaxID=319475 RepID=UPI00048769F0|nr:polysaccharide biosynthesis protein [Clostridium lundense]
MKDQSTTKGFAVLSAAGMIVKVLSLLYIPFLKSIITDEGYGVYGAAYSVYVFIYVITNSGIPVAISKLISELTAVKNYKDAVKSFKISRFILLLIGSSMTILMIISARFLSQSVHYDKAYLSILALSPAILFTSIASAYRGYFQGWGNMVPTAVSQVMEQIINTIFTLIFAALLMKYGIEAGCAGGTIGTSLGAFVSAAYLIMYYERHKKIKVPKGYNEMEIRRLSTKQILRKVISYGVPITICVGMTYAGNLIDVGNTKARLIAGGIPDEYASTLFGYLVKYQQLLNVPIAIVTSLAVAILPSISSAAALKDKGQVRDKIKYAFRLCFLIAIPSAFGLAVLSEPIFSMLKFGEGSFLMKYGSIVLVLMSIMQIQTTILQSIGKLYTATIYSVIGIACKLLANYFLISIPEINILGAVYGSIIGYTIPIILNSRMLKKSLSIKFKMLSHGLKPALSAVVMSIVVYVTYTSINLLYNFVGMAYLINALATVISIVLGIYAYLFCLILTGGVTMADFRYFPSKFMKVIPKFMMERVR